MISVPRTARPRYAAAVVSTRPTKDGPEPLAVPRQGRAALARRIIQVPLAYTLGLAGIG